MAWPRNGVVLIPYAFWCQCHHEHVLELRLCEHKQHFLQSKGSFPSNQLAGLLESHIGGEMTQISIYHHRVLKSREITWPTKVYIVKAMVFPVVMYRCESWTIWKVEHQRIMPLNCGAGTDSWESLWQPGDQTSQSWRKSTLIIHWKYWC